MVSLSCTTLWFQFLVPLPKMASVLLLFLLSLSLLRAASGAQRGFGDPKSGQPDDTTLLSGVPWFYTWGLAPHNNSDVFTQQFVPMVWAVKDIVALPTWAPHPSARVLLGFNEPNLRRQSNLTAAAACAAWPRVTAAARRHGLKVASPAANHCTPNGNCFQDPVAWFDAFFALPGCDLSTVDFIATHKYGCNATDTAAYVRSLHARYGKPVWLTEFSCGKAPMARQLEFMKQILPTFDAMPEDVLGAYAWFAARANKPTSGSNDVLIEGDTLTELGRFYNQTVP